MGVSQQVEKMSDDIRALKEERLERESHGNEKINLVVVTGMSGAGKTVAIQSFEDIGYFTIDNMPPSLVPKVIELVKHSEETDKIALVVDMRSRLFFDEINDILDKLESNEELNFKILFLDATDGELVSRYKETRRSHPLAADGRVLDGIKLERELLSPLKSLSQNVVDTTELTPRQLRKAISEQFSSEQDQSSFRIEVVSLVLNMDCHWMQIWFLMFVSCQILIMILHFVTSQVWIKRFLIMS